MRGRKSLLKIVLSEQDGQELEHLVRSTSVRAGVARRARIVLELAAGARLVEIARQTGVTEQVVRFWGRRFLKQRLEGLHDLPRTGRPPVFSPLAVPGENQTSSQPPMVYGLSLDLAAAFQKTQQRLRFARQVRVLRTAD